MHGCNFSLLTIAYDLCLVHRMGFISQDLCLPVEVNSSRFGLCPRLASCWSGREDAYVCMMMSLHQANVMLE